MILRQRRRHGRWCQLLDTKHVTKLMQSLAAALKGGKARVVSFLGHGGNDSDDDALSPAQEEQKEESIEDEVLPRLLPSGASHTFR